MDFNLSNKKIAIIATDYFEEAELISPKEALTQAGATVHVIAPHNGSIQGLQHIELGQKVAVDLTLAEADPNDYDGVVIPGGVVNADHLRIEETARDFLRILDGDEKPIAIICHGPWLLISSKLVRGRTLTSYPTLKDDIVNGGGEWQDREVVIDENLITSRNPGDLPAFNHALLEALAKQ